MTNRSYILTLLLMLAPCHLASASIGDKWVHIQPKFGVQSFPPRTDSNLLVFNSSFILHGGAYAPPCNEDCPSTVSYNDVWKSFDGENWNHVSDLPIPPGTSYGLIGFQSKLWLYSGTSVWSSPDAAIWNAELQHGVIGGGISVIYKSRLWAIYDKVWVTDDALNWTLVNDNPPVIGFPTVLNGRLWVIDFVNHDAWSSTDGVVWTLESSELNLPTPPDAGGSTANKVFLNPGDLIVVKSEVWLSGMYLNQDFTNPRRALLSTMDGINWADHSAQLPIIFFYDHAVSYNDRIWINVLDYSEETRAEAQHASDTNNDSKLGLDELLRAIQLYSVGSFHCNGTTEDGYKPGPGVTTCQTYSADYAPQDWRISLEEILRLIQLYNSNGFHACAGGEDGFCAGPASVP